jgi:hypothetical protein
LFSWQILKVGTDGSRIGGTPIQLLWNIVPVDSFSRAEIIHTFGNVLSGVVYLAGRRGRRDH